MGRIVDRRAYARRSTSEVSAEEAFEYWREVICAAFVQLSAEPVSSAPFQGGIEHIPIGDVELTTVTAQGQHVRRTSSLIAGSSGEFLLASIQRRGRGQVIQDGRIASLEAGDMAFYDSTRPYTLHFDDFFDQVVLQVPKPRLMNGDTRSLTARPLSGSGPAAPVSAFFTRLSHAGPNAPTGAGPLTPHALGLVTAAASIADEKGQDPADGVALLRQQVTDFLYKHAHESGLDADTVAAACRISRRTLYRLLGPGGVAVRLRRVRLERAQQMLVSLPNRPVEWVAFACGFGSESGFYRAFRAAHDCSPAEYRRRHVGGTSGQ